MQAMCSAHMVTTVVTYQHLRNLASSVRAATEIFCSNAILVAQREFVVDLETMTGVLFSTVWTPAILSGFFLIATARLLAVKAFHRR